MIHRQLTEVSCCLLSSTYVRVHTSTLYSLGFDMRHCFIWYLYFCKFYRIWPFFQTVIFFVQSHVLRSFIPSFNHIFKPFYPVDNFFSQESWWELSLAPGKPQRSKKLTGPLHRLSHRVVWVDSYYREFILTQKYCTKLFEVKFYSGLCGHYECKQSLKVILKIWLLSDSVC